jgi:hypothetical protein
MPIQGIINSVARELNKPIPLLSVKARPVRFMIMYKMISPRPVSKPYFKATLAVEGVEVLDSIN